MADDDLLVVGQAAATLAVLWPRRRSAPPAAVARAVGWGAVVAGGAVALAAAAQHGPRLTPRVAPPEDAALLTSGAYAVSRHPIYTALALAGAGVATLQGGARPWLAWAALLTVLDRKTRREERHLVERFGAEYEAYRSRTPRLVPTPRVARDVPPLT